MSATSFTFESGIIAWWNGLPVYSLVELLKIRMCVPLGLVSFNITTALVFGILEALLFLL